MTSNDEQLQPENGTDDGQRRRPDPLRWIWYDSEPDSARVTGIGCCTI